MIREVVSGEWRMVSGEWGTGNHGEEIGMSRVFLE